VIGYEHGLDTRPPRAKDVAFALARRAVSGSPADDRATTMSTEQETTTFYVPGASEPFDVPGREPVRSSLEHAQDGDRVVASREIKVEVDIIGKPQFRRVVEFIKAVEDYARVCADDDLHGPRREGRDPHDDPRAPGPQRGRRSPGPEPTETEDLADEMIFFEGVVRLPEWRVLATPPPLDETYTLTLKVRNRSYDDDRRAPNSARGRSSR
jgi:hypothetical protein